MVLASRLGNDTLRQWAESELDGYSDSTAVPDYRRVNTGLIYGNFSGPLQSRRMNLQVPISWIPADHREWATTIVFDDSIAHYQELISEAKARQDGQGSLQVPLPADFVVRHLGGEGQILEMHVCYEAWRPANTAMVEGFLDTVRNRVLALSLEIEREFPGLASDAHLLEPEQDRHLEQIFNIQVLGGTATIAAGNQSVSQATVVKGDRASLESALREVGVPRDEIHALLAALDADGPQAQSFGEKTQRWLGRMTELAARGTVSVSPNAVGGVVAGLILRYLGVG